MRKNSVRTVITFVSIILLCSCSPKEPITRRCKLGMFHGRVVDVNTGKPIEGAVVHVTYEVPAGHHGVSHDMAVRETLTDANGEYLIPKEKAVFHTRLGCGLKGRLQIFKFGYGMPGHPGYTKTCPEKEKERVRWADEPRCLTVEGKYLIWGLPKLNTKEEIWNNRPSHASNIPIEQQILLMQAINERRYYLGYDLFGLPEGYEQKLTPFPPPYLGPCKLEYKVYLENDKWEVRFYPGVSPYAHKDNRPECIKKREEMEELYYKHILKKN